MKIVTFDNINMIITVNKDHNYSIIMAGYKTNFGKNLKILRKNKKLSQTALGEQVGLTRNNIASYESGLVEVSTTSLLKIGLFFNVDIQELLEADFSSEEFQQKLHADPNEIVISDQIQGELDDFTTQTEKMSKILDGYQAFYDMQKENIESPQERDLYNTMDNILGLLRSLIGTNWKLIELIQK